MRRLYLKYSASLPPFHQPDSQSGFAEVSKFHFDSHALVIGGRIYALLALIAWVLFCSPGRAQQINAPDPQGGTISGTVMDTDSEVIPGATVELQGPVTEPPRIVKSNDNGAFEFQGVTPGTAHQIIVRASGCLPWASSPLKLGPGQFLILDAVKLRFSGGTTSVTVVASPVEIATEQVRVEEQQRVFGIIPNFYVVYDPNPAPLTPKLKFSLALRVSIDPVTFLGAGVIAGMDQAADTPNYPKNAKGFGQRLGANYANYVVGTMVGFAILPSLLHQDPRYFYKGTGTTKSRVRRAVLSAFICPGDNGRWQPNYSAIGGDLVAGAVSNAYYPASNRGAGLVLQNSLVRTGARIANNLLEEFVLRRFTTHSN